MDIEETMKAIRANCKRLGWDARVPSYNPAMFSEKMLLVVSEISEALEEFRNHRGLNEVYFTHDPTNRLAKPEGIPIELADVIIRIFDFCEANDIDIVSALEAKMRFNELRPFRHGNKLA